MLLDFIISNGILFAKVQHILKGEYFDKPLDSVVNFVQEYFIDYKTVPSTDIIKAETGVLIEDHDITKDQFDFVIDQIESFCKNIAFRTAIMTSADEIHNNEFGNAQERIKKAMSICVDTDLGINLFLNPAQRIKMAEEDIDPIRIGWDDYDTQTNLSKRGEMVLFAGGSGSGKSVLLTNIANKLSKQGLNVIYISLELKDTLVADRFDSIITGVPLRRVRDDLDHIEAIYQRIEHGYGDLLVKKLPVGSNANDIRSYIFEYELQSGHPPDAIIIDHLDLVSPNAGNKNDGAFDRDKQISEEIREIFIDYNSYGFTASQLNRDSIDVKNKSQAHIAGGLSKINTSDVSVAISRTDEQIDNGIVELQFLKLRNAAMKVHPVILHWCDDTLTISDPMVRMGVTTNAMQESTNTNTITSTMDQKESLDILLKRVKKR